MIAWEPPRRLVYSRHLRQDTADATEVEIAFAAAAEGTAVTITHRGWERLGSRGPELRERNVRGWAGLLPAFVAAVANGNGARKVTPLALRVRRGRRADDTLTHLPSRS